MGKKYINVQMNENNFQFMNRIRKEIMIENYINIPLNRIIELGLIEFRKNNSETEMKEKLVHFNRIGQLGRDGMTEKL